MQSNNTSIKEIASFLAVDGQQLTQTNQSEVKKSLNAAQKRKTFKRVVQSMEEQTVIQGEKRLSRFSQLTLSSAKGNAQAADVNSKTGGPASICKQSKFSQKSKNACSSSVISREGKQHYNLKEKIYVTAIEDTEEEKASRHVVVTEKIRQLRKSTSLIRLFGVEKSLKILSIECLAKEPNVVNSHPLLSSGYCEETEILGKSTQQKYSRSWNFESLPYVFDSLLDTNDNKHEKDKQLNAESKNHNCNPCEQSHITSPFDQNKETDLSNAPQTELRESAPSRDKQEETDQVLNLPIRDIFSQHIADTSEIPNMQMSQSKKVGEQLKLKRKRFIAVNSQEHNTVHKNGFLIQNDGEDSPQSPEDRSIPNTLKHIKQRIQPQEPCGTFKKAISGSSYQQIQGGGCGGGLSQSQFGGVTCSNSTFNQSHYGRLKRRASDHNLLRILNDDQLSSMNEINLLSDEQQQNSGICGAPVQSTNQSLLPNSSGGGSTNIKRAPAAGILQQSTFKKIIMAPIAGAAIAESGRIQFQHCDEEMKEDFYEETASPTFGESRKVLGSRGGIQKGEFDGSKFQKRIGKNLDISPALCNQDEEIQISESDSERNESRRRREESERARLEQEIYIGGEYDFEGGHVLTNNHNIHHLPKNNRKDSEDFMFNFSDIEDFDSQIDESEC